MKNIWKHYQPTFDKLSKSPYTPEQHILTLNTNNVILTLSTNNVSSKIKKINTANNI